MFAPLTHWSRGKSASVSWESVCRSDRSPCLLPRTSLVPAAHPKKSFGGLHGDVVGSLQMEFADDAVFLPPSGMIQVGKETRCPALQVRKLEFISFLQG